MRGRIMRGCLTVLAVALFALIFIPARGNELRLSTMGNCGIALYDQDNQINPFDYGYNPAYLLMDYQREWIRFTAGVQEESGDLKRKYDPYLTNNLFAGFSGIKRLGERHVTSGSVTYKRYNAREIYHSIEIDQYNDPFYLTDLTTGDFEYYGPSLLASYSLMLRDNLHIGAGLEYDISTGLKQEYTRPEIVHNYLKATLGMVYQHSSGYMFGLTLSPIRNRNRTNFDKTDEGYDNIINRYSGEGIYEVRSFSSKQISEVEWGGEVTVQNFYLGKHLKLGSILTYALHQTESRYDAFERALMSFWETERFDFRFLGRYTPEGLPLTLGLTGRVMSNDGWAKRPEYDDVLLYDNPYQMASIGGGFSYLIRRLNLTATADYIMNSYQIEANDYGASLFREAEVVQNIGRVGLEYSLYGLHSVRLGFEVIDYPIDRWLKLPANMDSYRVTGGFGYQFGYWNIEMELMYSDRTRDGISDSRQGLSGIMWFTLFR
ncbi:MAG: hypothetical protein GF417_10045 [Candidatus Latescibacteria bacterium]|nr:hypothetical protein [bacterium]MBD3424767.1 hypothetical protein [Candidatus Latescibacterota bacterium]